MADLREELGVKPIDDNPYFNLLVYGDSGVGKTELGGSADDSPDTSPVLFIDLEGGTRTIRSRTKIDVVKVRTMAEVEKIGNVLYKQEGTPYKTVVIDSGTELQKLDMKMIMEQAFNKNPDKVDKDVPSPREWGITLSHMRKIVRHFKDLPCNFIMTCLVDSIQDKQNENIYYMHPSLGGKSRTELPGFFDFVGYYHIVGEGNDLTRRLQFSKSKRVVAKERDAPALLPYVDDPSIPLLWEKINAKGTS